MVELYQHKKIRRTTTILVKTAAALVAGILIADKIDIFTSLTIYISFLTANFSAGIIFKNKTGRYSFLATVILIGITVCQYASSYEMNGLYPVDDKFIEISGYVSELPELKNDKYTYIITCDGAKYKDVIYPAKENVMLRSETKLEYAQNVSVRGFLKRFDSKKNYSDFDYARYMKSKKVFYSISDYEIASDNSKRPSLTPHDFANLYKGNITKLIDTYISGDNAGLLKAVMTGNKKEFTDDFYMIMQKTGTIRFLYQAYLHILIILLLIELFVPFFGRKFAQNATVVIIMIYALINADSAAILKASFVSIFTIIFLRKYGYLHFPDILSSAVIVILISNPLFVYNSGFILSVTASWLFFMLNDAAYDLFKPIKPKSIRRYISIWLLGTIGTAPVIAYCFDGIAPLTFLFSFIYLPAVAVILVLFPFIRLEIMLIGKSVIFSKGILSSLWILKKLPYFIDSLPLSSIRLARPKIITIILFYLAVVVIKDIFNKKQEKFKTQALIAILTGGILSVMLINIFSLGSAKITFVNVGQGDGAIIELPKGERIIVDGGGGEEYSDYDAGEKVFLPYLSNEGLFRIDMAIVSHFHKDHCLGTIAAMKNMNVHTVAMPDLMPDNKYRIEIEEIARQKGIEILYLGKGDKITFESGAELNVISPSKNDFTEENDTSIVFTLSVNGFQSLFTGDATKNIEEKYINDFYDIDLLKVAHHGSSTSSTKEFLNKVLPEYAVISAGKDNTYNLPDDTIVKRIENTGAHILRTDELGDIQFTISKNGLMSYTTFYSE